MEPVARKRFAECPRCHSSEVRVPWAPSAARLRRRILEGLSLVWIIGAGGTAYGAMRGGAPWPSLLAACGAASVLAGLAIRFGPSAYHCASCGKRWRAK